MFFCNFFLGCIGDFVIKLMENFDIEGIEEGEEGEKLEDEFLNVRVWGCFEIGDVNFLFLMNLILG